MRRDPRFTTSGRRGKHADRPVDGTTAFAVARAQLREPDIRRAPAFGHRQSA